MCAEGIIKISIMYNMSIRLVSKLVTYDATTTLAEIRRYQKPFILPNETFRASYLAAAFIP
jgi:hypothetical protein